MNWAITKNLQAIQVHDIPRLPLNTFREQLLKACKQGKRLVQFFGDAETDGIVLYTVLADDEHSYLYVASTHLKDRREYPSFTNYLPAFHLFEREIFEQFSITPVGHPWLKPVRKGIAEISKAEIPYPFFSMDGEEVHEVGVGPIHAGIIEPGHFRFACVGEEVHHLEIQLGFQHRGIEKLFLEHQDKQQHLLGLAESIAGDTVIGHSGTYARAVEALSGITVSRRAMIIRTIALELERIGIHLGDLSALATDVAYLTGSAVFGALRTSIINTTLALCGSRFGRGLMTPGGVNFDISEEIQGNIRTIIDDIENRIELAAEVMFASSSVLSRFEKTGVVSFETAQQIGMVGPAARASGLALDVRSDHPFGGYIHFPVHKMTLTSGDVFARAYIRYIEIMQSIRIIREQLAHLPKGELKKELHKLKPHLFVISMAEGWRGEIVHTVITDKDGRLKRYKIKDPSFHNWFGLALAVRGNGISDFPVCNKSFNLSYCGFDL
ncbi:NADH-quinone oxidoreductase subunit C [bacterium]|nr:NADH-quinone oxidoreductase subunit C [bacterium]MBU1633998.1 NADH-quinone oxidoreductase subunit C [bacterium]MBU1874228.1 NADH-quinone oxidoreductase subunit C [bacterium]